MMKITVKRHIFTEISTIGDLCIDGVFFCYTLEDKVRKDNIKVEGKTAIPSGTYKVIIDHSNRFNRDMPHILDVPGFLGVRLHAGNTSENTEGCLLVGSSRSKDFIGNSRTTFAKLFEKMQSSKEPIEITIV